MLFFSLSSLPDSFRAVFGDLEADFFFESQRHQYFDYGQQSYRTLTHTRKFCVGPDCAHPFSKNILAEDCESGGMQVWRRVGPPVLTFLD